MSDQEVTIVVCVNERFGDKPSCAASGSKEIANAIEEHISSNQLNFKVKRIQCFGRCFNAPVVRIAGGDFFEKFNEPEAEGLRQVVGLTTIGLPTNY